jgi:hypothetical protein
MILKKFKFFLISESRKISIRLVVEEFKFSGSKNLATIATPRFVSSIPQINDGLRAVAERIFNFNLLDSPEIIKSGKSLSQPKLVTLSEKDLNIPAAQIKILNEIRPFSYQPDISLINMDTIINAPVLSGLPRPIDMCESNLGMPEEKYLLDFLISDGESQTFDSPLRSNKKVNSRMVNGEDPEVGNPYEPSQNLAVGDVFIETKNDRILYDDRDDYIDEIRSQVTEESSDDEVLLQTQARNNFTQNDESTVDDSEGSQYFSEVVTKGTASHYNPYTQDPEICFDSEDSPDQDNSNDFGTETQVSRPRTSTIDRAIDAVDQVIHGNDF